MKWELNKSRPITQQIFEYICISISDDELKTNEKLPSVRELALNLCVNPNTIQKSYELLEERNVIYSVRGSGWYVNENVTTAKEVVEEIIENKCNSFFDEMKQLGFDLKTTIKLLNERYGDDNE